MIPASPWYCSPAVSVARSAAPGLAGGRIDALLMRLVDSVLAFPGLLLALALVAISTAPSM